MKQSMQCVSEILIFTSSISQGEIIEDLRYKTVLVQYFIDKIYK